MEVVEVVEEEVEVVVTSDVVPGRHWTGCCCCRRPGSGPAASLPLSPACQPASKYKRYAALSVVRGPATTCTHWTSSLITAIWEATGPHCSLGKNILKYRLPFIQKVRADPVCLRSEKVQSNRIKGFTSTVIKNFSLSKI